MDDPPVEDWEALAAYTEAARLLTGTDPAPMIVRRPMRLTAHQRELIARAIEEIAEEEAEDPP